MTSLRPDDRGLVFDISELTPDQKREYLEPYRLHFNFILLGYNRHVNEVIDNYCFDKPTFENPDKIIYLNHEDLAQYQLIKHLPWEVILDYFEQK